MSKKLRILQLAPRFPFPEDDGGKIGIANIFKQFSKEHEVLLFAFDDGKIIKSAKEEAKEFGEIYLCKHSTENTKFRIFYSIFKTEPLYLFKHYSKRVYDELLRIALKFKPNIIHADHTAMMPLAVKLKKELGIPLGQRLHNIEWMIWQRYADLLPKYHPIKIYINSQAHKLAEAEADYFSKFDVGFPITTNDLNIAKKMAPNAKLRLATAGVDTNKFTTDDKIKRNKYEIIIATVYSWRHNIDGLLWFIKKVFPLIQKEFKDTQLKLIGKNLNINLPELNQEGIQAIGYVDDVRLHLNKASVYIVPLFVGSGIRIKILEAMAMKLPVISTTIGAEGIKTNYENGLFIADEPEDFADAIIALFSSENSRDAIGEKAREFIINNYSWAKSVEIMLKEYKGQLQNK